MNRRIVAASANRAKLAELGAWLGADGWRLIPQGELGVAPAAEDAASYVENALGKARHACRLTGLPALADDSGLEVDALGGRPGIHSARYAGSGAGDADNMAKLLAALAAAENTEAAAGTAGPDHCATVRRSARFRCVLVYMRRADDPAPLICEGTWEGCITEQPRGATGFGYDPIFYLPHLKQTAAQLPAARKNRLSHRARAMRRLRVALRAVAPLEHRP